MWFQLQIEQCPRERIEELSELLLDTGALAVTLTDQHDQPVLEPAPGTTPLWLDVVVNALYAEARETLVVQKMLAQHFDALIFSIHPIADKDWERVWMDEFKPQCFGKRLWVCPTWTPPPFPDAVNLILDPGLAFGTGTHPTTALCLSWLDAADLEQKTLIDYGCGSGILALAALKLGALQVQAVDIDEQALQATRSNAENNEITAKQLIIGHPEALEGSADIVMANILLTPLLDLVKRFQKLLKSEGFLVVSGLLNEQAPQLIEAYAPYFNLHTSTQLEEWSLLVFQVKKQS